MEEKRLKSQRKISSKQQHVCVLLIKTQKNLSGGRQY